MLFSISLLCFNTWKLHWKKPYKGAYSDPLNDLPPPTIFSSQSFWISAGGKFKPFAFALNSFIHSLIQDTQLRDLVLLDFLVSPLIFKALPSQPSMSRPPQLPSQFAFPFRLVNSGTTKFFTRILPVPRIPHSKRHPLVNWDRCEPET